MNYTKAARRDDAWYELSSGWPRHKYSPKHWYAWVYWTSVDIGWRFHRLCLVVYRPVALAVMGFLRPWRNDL